MQFDWAEEVHTHEVDITSLPVESVRNISDHVNAEQPTVSFKVVVSDNPLVDVGEPAGPTRGVDAHDLMVSLCFSATPVDVYTSARNYGTCLIQKIVANRGAGTTNGWHGTVDIVQISTSTVEESSEFPRRRPVNKANGAEKDAGTQPKTDAEAAKAEAVVSASFLYGVIRGDDS